MSKENFAKAIEVKAKNIYWHCGYNLTWQSLEKDFSLVPNDPQWWINAALVVYGKNKSYTLKEHAIAAAELVRRRLQHN